MIPNFQKFNMHYDTKKKNANKCDYFQTQQLSL